MSLEITGQLTTHYAKWETGALSVLAFGGGRLANITRRYLIATGKYDKFYRLLERHYTSIFGNESFEKSETVAFALPSATLPPSVGDYSICNPGKWILKWIKLVLIV